ncbi:MAG: response regulator [Acidobacteriota bacterium]
MGKVDAQVLKEESLMQPLQSGSQLLFVDDEKTFQEYVTENLGGHGYEVITADYWQEAKNLISGQNIRPDIVFYRPRPPQTRRLDLQQVCWEVDEIPLVVVSSGRDPQEIVQAIRLGATDYLCKPIAACGESPEGSC